MKIETLLDLYENAIRKLEIDEAFEYADPNRESSEHARKLVNKYREQILKRIK